MKNEKANVRCGSERYVCAVCAKTKNSQVYLGYYSSFICDCGYRSDESEYADDYRFCESIKGELVSGTEKHPFTLNYPNKLKAYLKNPKKSSDVKNIIDTLGIPEKVERFTIRERRFVTNEFGKEVALPVCEMIIE